MTYSKPQARAPLSQQTYMPEARQHVRTHMHAVGCQRPEVIVVS